MGYIINETSWTDSVQYRWTKCYEIVGKDRADELTKSRDGYKWDWP